MTEVDRSGPLAGVRVVELARVLAGPWAGQALADLGAEVIKVERPGSGDDTRAWGPPFAKDKQGRDLPGMSAYFMSTNRGKRSVTIDFAQSEGAELARTLIDSADVVIENFKLGGLAHYGLDYASLAARNPKLVYCSITGFGQDGPYAARPGYDFIIQAMGGLMSISGASDGEPMKSGLAVSDLFTGLYATIGIMAALTEARATGRGKHLDMALFDVQVAMLSNQALSYLVSGKVPAAMGNTHPSIVPYQVFATADGHVVIAAGNDGQYARLCALAGQPALAADPRYATNPARVVNRAELIPQLAAIIAAKPSAFWLEGLETSGVPAGPINSVAATFADPQTMARGLRQSLALVDGTAVAGIASPVREAGQGAPPGAPPPMLGQDTSAILSELGIGADEVSRLRAKRIV